VLKTALLILTSTFGVLLEIVAFRDKAKCCKQDSSDTAKMRSDMTR